MRIEPSFGFSNLIPQDDITMRASLKPELIGQDGATINIDPNIVAYEEVVQFE